MLGRLAEFSAVVAAELRGAFVADLEGGRGDRVRTGPQQAARLEFGDGKLALKRGDAGFADYLYWLHFANGTLQPLVLQVRYLERVDPSETNALLRATQQRFDLVLSLLDERLGVAAYLAGPELTAADIMSVFSLTTMRLFKPYDLSPWPNILAYLQRIGARPAYLRALQKADPDMIPLLGYAPRP